MYASTGYDPMPERYGHYADTEVALYFCKDLPPIRLATEHELPVLQDIERAAGQPFADIGMSLVADDEPPTIAELRTHLDAARCWVWVDDENLPVGYLVAADVDDASTSNRCRCIRMRATRSGSSAHRPRRCGGTRSWLCRIDTHHIPRRPVERTVLRATRLRCPRRLASHTRIGDDSRRRTRPRHRAMATRRDGARTRLICATGSPGTEPRGSPERSVHRVVPPTHRRGGQLGRGQFGSCASVRRECSEHTRIHHDDPLSPCVFRKPGQYTPQGVVDLESTRGATGVCCREDLADDVRSRSLSSRAT